MELYYSTVGLFLDIIVLSSLVFANLGQSSIVDQLPSKGKSNKNKNQTT